jgi:two-component system, LytTR family, response regulator LytT
MEKASDILIVEDELVIAEAIAEILKNSGYTDIRITDSVEQAIKEIEASRPSLILTDINLGKEKTGIDLGHLLQFRYRIPFIYITSYSNPEIVGKAKHTLPNAYIIKPFKNEDLLVAIELALFNSSNKYENIGEGRELVLKEGRAMVSLSCRNIMWVEAIGNYTSINISNGKRRVMRTSMTEIESQLNCKPFMRIHESYLVNCAYITETKPNAILINGNELPIGKGYQTFVSSYFNC